MLAPLLVWYRNSFGRMRDRNHFLLGCCVAALQTLFVVLIVGLDGFLITPDNDSFASVLNPVYVPLLVHRLIGNVGWTALLLAGLATLLAWRSTTTPRSTGSSSGRRGSISASAWSPPC